MRVYFKYLINAILKIRNMRIFHINKTVNNYAIDKISIKISDLNNVCNKNIVTYMNIEKLSKFSCLTNEINVSPSNNNWNKLALELMSSKSRNGQQ